MATNRAHYRYKLLLPFSKIAHVCTPMNTTRCGHHAAHQGWHSTVAPSQKSNSAARRKISA
ncbi:MAG: hypothetical protein ACRDAM_22265, partial [Casimicrobium sp.]